jgi:hypothetical protein
LRALFNYPGDREMASSVRALSLLFVAVAAMAAAGCNDDDPPAVAPAPVPAPSPTPAPPSPAPAPVSGPASECFPTLSGVAGTTYQLNYAVSGAVRGTSGTTGTVSSGGTFNGVSGLITQVQSVTTNYSFPASVAGTSTVQVELHQAFDGSDIVTHGSTTTVAVPGTGNVATRVVYDPPARDKRFTLSAGGTVNYMTNVATTTTPPGATRTMSLTSFITYAGQESITVPAGTFSACKFQTNANGSAYTEWLIKGNGMLARSVSPAADGSGEVVLELEAGSRLNGAPL